ncbi:breast cancer anti-estrogen resistance protein 3 homolog [Lytechinus pictus]|uniref:breast cancer anti-estrogen resistance protein 3 homolog n=1 Tax=Lytechinus pictus TaxID=7653 RepID=UPI0030B9D27F
MSLQDMSPDDLRKLLEEEFKLPSEDVRSHAWFHGGISREKAEKLIRENGDFLVRDSISKPGNFVLTVRWKAIPMHFVVNKVVLKAHSPYASVQYQFEKECFDTIPSLIKFYVGNCKPVSQASGAVIQRPINRTLPLSYTDNKYAATNKSHPGGYIYGQLQKKVVTPRRGSNGPEGLRQRSGSNPTPFHLNGGVEKQLVNRADSHPLLGRISPLSQSESSPSPSPLSREQRGYTRTGSEPILSPSREYGQVGPIESDYAETKPCLNTSTSDDEGSISMTSIDGSSTTASPSRVPSVSPTPQVQVTPDPSEQSQPEDSADAKDTTESKTEESTVSPTESVAVATTESPTKSLTETTTESATESTTESATDSTTESTLQSTSESTIPSTMVTTTVETKTPSPKITSSLVRPIIREHIYSEIDHQETVIDPKDSIRYTMLHDEDTSPAIPPIIQDPQESSPGQIEGQNLDVKPRKRVNSGTRFSVLDSDYSRVTHRSSPNHLEKKPQTLQTILPLRETESIFHPQDFVSSLLEPENKPLDKTCMDTIRQMMLDANPLALARHLTLVDTEVCRIGHGSNNNSMPGLELLCLPHGGQFRLDIIERHNSLKMFCMATLLTCEDLEVRVQILHQWIQLAETLRGSLGNLFSFSTIMDALATKQVAYLRSTWDQLRSRFTNTAVNYDTKLRSLLKSINAGENVVPLTKTSLPHILPIIQLLERDWSTALDRDWSQTATKDVLDSVPNGESWEESAPSYGLDIILSHLQNAHMLAQQTNLYRINAHAKLAKHPPEEGLLDAFKTELHLRLLWGSKATTDNAMERYRLLQQVLSIMAQKLEFASNSV